MSEVQVQLKDPAVLRAVCHVPTMQRWEILRRSERALSAAEVAASAHAPVKAVQESLDRLVAAHLAESIPASSRRREITYRAAMKRLFLKWDRHDPAGVKAAQVLGDSMRDYSRKLIAEAEVHPGAELVETLSLAGSTSVVLLRDDAERVRSALLSLYSMLMEADRRARAAEHADAAIPFHLAFDFRRLWQADPPWAEFVVSESESHDRTRDLFSASPAEVLSPRELEIATLLQQGKSRPEVARQLGLTPNTVSTLSKTIYRKLGVHGRAELAERLRFL
ncbi:MAG: hypothetical protein GC172_03995 [Phycisphaera sp.]|nr:hypothetical protein [Phycisphaera sp.]